MIFGKRNNPEKTQKDIDAAVKILRALVDIDESASIKQVFESAPKRWQRKIIRGLREIGEENILDILR